MSKSNEALLSTTELGAVVRYAWSRRVIILLFHELGFISRMPALFWDQNSVPPCGGAHGVGCQSSRSINFIIQVPLFFFNVERSTLKCLDLLTKLVYPSVVIRTRTCSSNGQWHQNCKFSIVSSYQRDEYSKDWMAFGVQKYSHQATLVVRRWFSSKSYWTDHSSYAVFLIWDYDRSRKLSPLSHIVGWQHFFGLQQLQVFSVFSLHIYLSEKFMVDFQFARLKNGSLALMRKNLRSPPARNS